MNEQLMADPNIKAFVEAINALKEMEEELFTEETLNTINLYHDSLLLLFYHIYFSNL